MGCFLHLTEMLPFVELNILTYLFLNPILFHLLSYILIACPDCISLLLRSASTLLAVVQDSSKDGSVKDGKATDGGNADESVTTCANCVKNEKLEKERARIFAKQEEDLQKKLYDNCVKVCMIVSKKIGMEYEKEISRLRKIIEEKTSSEKGSDSDSSKTVNNCRQRRTQKRQALQQKWQQQHEPVQQELFLQRQPAILQQPVVQDQPVIQQQQQQIQQQQQQIQQQQQQLQQQKQQIQQQQQQIQQPQQQQQQEQQRKQHWAKNSTECWSGSRCGRSDCIHHDCRIKNGKRQETPSFTEALAKLQTSKPRLWTMPTYIPRNQSHLPPEKNEDSGYSFSSDGSNESFSQSDSNMDTYMGSGYDSY